MVKQIKFHFLHTLFRLCAYCADKSGGWRVFVKPKMLLGTLIIGLGMTACQSNKNHSSNSLNTNQSKDSFKNNPVTDETGTKKDTLTQSSSGQLNKKKIISRTYCYFRVPDTLLANRRKVVDNNETAITDSAIFIVVEVMPQFSDGDIASYLAKNIHYPPVAMCYDGGSFGRVICQFVVEKDGSITNVQVVRSIDPSLDKEAVRVISSMPKWIPGERNGEKVRVRYTLPINFRMQ